MDVALKNQTLDGLSEFSGGHPPRATERRMIMECKHMQKINDLVKLKDALESLKGIVPITAYDGVDITSIALRSIARAIAELIPEAIECVIGENPSCKL